MFPHANITVSPTIPSHHTVPSSVFRFPLSPLSLSSFSSVFHFVIHSRRSNPVIYSAIPSVPFFLSPLPSSYSLHHFPSSFVPSSTPSSPPRYTISFSVPSSIPFFHSHSSISTVPSSPFSTVILFRLPFRHLSPPFHPRLPSPFPVFAIASRHALPSYLFVIRSVFPSHHFPSRHSLPSSISPSVPAVPSLHFPRFHAKILHKSAKTLRILLFPLPFTSFAYLPLPFKRSHRLYAYPGPHFPFPSPSEW